MLETVQSLLILQDRDQQLANIDRELEAIPKDKKRAQDQLADDQLALDTAKKAEQDNEVAMKNLELDIATYQNTIEKLKVQQFETKKNDEYNKFGEEIIRYQDSIDTKETQQLELLENADDLQEKHRAAKATYDNTQGSIDEQLTELDAKAQKLQHRRDELQAERDQLAAPIDEDALALYERLLKSKGNDPVVPLKGAQCGGCHMKVTGNTVTNTNAAQAITQCENCGRILYAE